MLRPRQRIDGAFFARLLDEMSNAHTLLVRTTTTESAAYKAARTLRDELPVEAFGVYVDHDERAGDWHVVVYHQLPKDLRVAQRRDNQGHVWIGPKEVARVLRISPDHASFVMDHSGLEVRRVGGRLERRIRQQDLVILANRKGRWRHRTRKAS